MTSLLRPSVFRSVVMDAAAFNAAKFPLPPKKSTDGAAAHAAAFPGSYGNPKCFSKNPKGCVKHKTGVYAVGVQAGKHPLDVANPVVFQSPTVKTSKTEPTGHTVQSGAERIDELIAMCADKPDLVKKLEEIKAKAFLAKEVSEKAEQAGSEQTDAPPVFDTSTAEGRVAEINHYADEELKSLAAAGKKGIAFYEAKERIETWRKSKLAALNETPKKENSDEEKVPVMPKIPDGLSDGQKTECLSRAASINATLLKAAPDAGAAVTEISVTPFEVTYTVKPKTLLTSKQLGDYRALAGAETRRIVSVGDGKYRVTVPNETVRDVSYSEMSKDDGFRKKLEGMTVPGVLGVDSDGDKVAVDLATLPHLLVGGSTGGGKSAVTNAILMGAMETKSPDELEVYLSDPKGTEFSVYRDAPHVRELITGADTPKTLDMLDGCVAEMRHRNEFFTELGKAHGVTIKDLGAYRKFRAEHPELGLPNLRPRLVALEEFANFSHTEYGGIGAAVQDRVKLLGEQARSAGIHLLVTTQDPTNANIGSIKANFPARIALKTDTAVRSRTILDQRGAESLTGRGDMLLKSPGSSALKRVKGAFINDKPGSSGGASELDTRIAALKAKHPAVKPESAPPKASEQEMPSSAKNQPDGDGGSETVPEPDGKKLGKTVDISHLGFLTAIASAVSEGLKGNSVTYNPAAFNRLGAERWKRHLESLGGGEPDWSQHRLSEIHPLPETATSFQREQFRKWCAKFNEAAGASDPRKAQIVKRQYVDWLKDEGLAGTSTPAEGKNPYLALLGRKPDSGA